MAIVAWREAHRRDAALPERALSKSLGDGFLPAALCLQKQFDYFADRTFAALRHGHIVSGALYLDDCIRDGNPQADALQDR
jgi:hypothetical protein